MITPFVNSQTEKPNILVSDLKFPEGPAFGLDGSLWAVELKGESLINLKDGIKDNLVTRIGLQVRFTNAETGVIFGASGLGEATTKRELTLLSDATVDPIKFNQSTISICTKKALDIACARILKRMVDKKIFDK